MTGLRGVGEIRVFLTATALVGPGKSTKQGRYNTSVRAGLLHGAGIKSIREGVSIELAKPVILLDNDIALLEEVRAEGVSVRIDDGNVESQPHRHS